MEQLRLKDKLDEQREKERYPFSEAKYYPIMDGDWPWKAKVFLGKIVDYDKVRSTGEQMAPDDSLKEPMQISEAKYRLAESLKPMAFKYDKLKPFLPFGAIEMPRVIEWRRWGHHGAKDYRTYY